MNCAPAARSVEGSTSGGFRSARRCTAILILASLLASAGLASDRELPESPSSLDARQVACSAVVRWKPALGLCERANSIRQMHQTAICERKKQGASALSRFLELQAGFQEDVGAASAMRAYYGLIGLREHLGWIEAGSNAVQTQYAKQKRLMELGSEAGVDLSSLDRKRIELEEQSLKTNSQLRQLTSLLLGLTEMDLSMHDWIVEPLMIQETPIDTQGLVNLALRERRDLQAWQYLACNLDEDTAPMFVSAIASMFGGFGLPIPTASCVKSCVNRLLHCGDDSASLVETLRKELRVIAETHRDWIKQSVTEKAELLQLAYSLHRVELKRIESWLDRLEQLERLEGMGKAKPEERAVAEAGLLQSRSSEVSRRLDVKLAEVALAETVGGLATRSCRGEAWLPTGLNMASSSSVQ